VPFTTGMWKWKLEAVKFLRKRKHFEERSWKRKQTRKLFEEPEAEAFFINHGTGLWKRKLEAVKFFVEAEAEAL